MNLERIIMRPIQLFKTKFLVTFPCIYDVRVLKLSSSNSAPDSMSNDDVMTKTMWSNFEGRHKQSVPIINGGVSVYPC